MVRCRFRFTAKVQQSLEDWSKVSAIGRDRATLESSVTIPVNDDALFEPEPETFSFTLSDPQGGATFGPITTLTVTIIDNDQPPDELFKDGFESPPLAAR